VQAAIQARIAEKAMSADEVLLRLAEQARGEQIEYLLDDGTVDLDRLIADGKGHLAKGIKWDRAGNLVVEFYDAQSALALIGRYHRLFVDRTELTGVNRKAIEIQVCWDDNPESPPAAPPLGAEGSEE